MARWVLGCKKCSVDFTHAEIPPGDGPLDPFIPGPQKPEFPTVGATVSCPNCGEAEVYQRHELIYRMD